MKKITMISVISIVVSLLMSSCSSSYSCPTYSKANDTKLIKTDSQTRI